jgi:hypothetical protein
VVLVKGFILLSVREKLKRWLLSKLKIILIIQICLIKVQTFGSLSPLGGIVATEKLIEAMTEANQTRTQYETHLANAWAKNVAISSPNAWEMNERSMNFELIRWIDKGIDSLDASERMNIETLSKTCVFQNGPAVYKARSLWSNYEPDAIFDDRIYCIATANKGGSNSNDVDSLMLAESGIVLNTLNENGETTVSNQNATKFEELIEVSVFPNPATNYIIVNHTGKNVQYFKLYNSIGQVVFEGKLSNSANSVRIQLLGIANGLYHYEVEFGNEIKTRGKLIILN